jgi:membrane protein
MAWIHRLIDQVRQLITQPMHELTHTERRVRYAIELGYYCWRTMKQHRASQMAAALTYRTMFSLVPTLVLALMLINAMGGIEHFGDDLQDKAYVFLGLDDFTSATVSDDPNAVPETGTAEDIRQRVDDVVNQISLAIEKVSFAKITAVGFGVLIWAALALVITIEQCFNMIYGAPTGRPWYMRVIMYWGVITLGPALLLSSLALSTMFGEWVKSIWLIGPIFGYVNRFIAVAVCGVAMTALYTLLPNTHVRFRSALIGGFTAAIFWEISKLGFALYVGKAVPYSKLYGSLFLIPLAMFWMYLNWWIVLFGLEITYTLQTLPDFQRRQKQQRDEQRLSGDPMWIIPIMARIGKAFEYGDTVNQQTLAEELDLPLQSVAQFASLLATTGFIHVVLTRTGGEEGYALARSPQQIRMTELLELTQTLQSGPEASQEIAGWNYLNQLADAQRNCAADATLASVVNSS